MRVLDEVNFFIGTGSSYDDLKADGKIDAIKTIFATDRINDKANKINFYFFSENSHDKITSEIKNKYIDEVFEIAKNTFH